MVEIKECSREFTEVEQYLMTIAPSIISMKDVPDGTHITVDGILTFEDTKESTGEIADILSVITPEKKVYSCQSSTFKRSIRDISNIMKGKSFTIVKRSEERRVGKECRL